MQGDHLFEYAVIRVVPRVEREEFINVGIIVYCRDRNFLQAKFSLDEHRLCTMCETVDIPMLINHLRSLDHICTGADDGGPIARLDIASRFRWLTATRSTIVQTSKVHPGICTDPRETLSRLYDQLVG